jgi:hypothetical protein
VEIEGRGLRQENLGPGDCQRQYLCAHRFLIPMVGKADPVAPPSLGKDHSGFLIQIAAAETAAETGFLQLLPVALASRHGADSQLVGQNPAEGKGSGLHRQGRLLAPGQVLQESPQGTDHQGFCIDSAIASLGRWGRGVKAVMGMGVETEASMAVANRKRLAAMGREKAEGSVEKGSGS